MESRSDLSPQRLLRSLIEGTPDRIYFKDKQGHFLMVNQATCDFFKMKDEGEVLGKTDFDIFLPEHANAAFADEQWVIKNQKPIIGVVERENFPDGRVRWSSTTKLPLTNESGEVVGTCGISRDVTEEHEKNDRIRMYAEELADKQEQLDYELNMAREIQQALLPHSYGSLALGPAVEKGAIQLGHRYLPTGHVGGDFFYIQEVSPREIGVLVTDVMGHGVHAALVTALQRSLVAELREYRSDPGLYVTEMGWRLMRYFAKLPNPLFLTAFYVVLDASTGDIRFANAGHPVPLHICAKQGKAIPLVGEGGKHSPALGVVENASYATQTAFMEAGDRLLMYTDGLCDDEEVPVTLDQETLRKWTDGAQGFSLQELLDAVINGARQRLPAKSFADDVCVVGMELNRLL